MKEERNCAFQYYDGKNIIEDISNITLIECKQLFNHHYEDMIISQTQVGGIEVAIWINMDNDNDYKETLIHLKNPRIENNRMCELVYFSKYRA